MNLPQWTEDIEDVLSEHYGNRRNRYSKQFRKDLHNFGQACRCVGGVGRCNGIGLNLFFQAKKITLSDGLVCFAYRYIVAASRKELFWGFDR